MFNFNQKRAKLLIMMHFRCLLLAKKVSIYAFSECKFFCLKIRSCKFFDKFQICTFIDFMVYKLFYILFSVEGTAFKRCFETKILYIIHPLQYFNGNYTGIFHETFLYRSGLLGHEISGAPQIFLGFL